MVRAWTVTGPSKRVPSPELALSESHCRPDTTHVCPICAQRKRCQAMVSCQACHKTQKFPEHLAASRARPRGPRHALSCCNLVRPRSPRGSWVSAGHMWELSWCRRLQWVFSEQCFCWLQRRCVESRRGCWWLSSNQQRPTYYKWLASPSGAKADCRVSQQARHNFSLQRRPTASF